MHDKKRRPRSFDGDDLGCSATSQPDTVWLCDMRWPLPPRRSAPSAAEATREQSTEQSELAVRFSIAIARYGVYEEAVRFLKSRSPTTNPADKPSGIPGD